MPDNDQTNEARSEEPGRRYTDNFFCSNHEENTLAIGKHTGQWKLLLWILGLGFTALLTILGLDHNTQQNAANTQRETIKTIADSVHSIDKIMSAYVASHSAESRDGFRRISENEKDITTIKGRLILLETLTHKKKSNEN